ncbi:cell wall-binding repeat-containing protein [Desulfosporosinus shakirovi]|uniref:cell wall-binding repeat-containing protein n=1 Tax=Desulfosporosinus shakirovi TaxID=2885154 RepID=UPI001E479CC9|nr:cell wall-binding repeat-containing protein [Desulfosporosinus sp. SRJS8]MCB8817242.1 cell wall-binding repeat-containing protein [Desulfosporosinus sp. SRJS8]
MKKTKKALASIAIAGMTLSMIPFNVFAASTVPTRLAGVTAEQTAVQIAEQTGYTGAAILASSTSYGMVDALTAGPLAASLKAPILLTGAGTTLDAATKAELTKLEVKTVYVTSGTAVIKQGVIDELKAMGIEVIALGGFDRAETSVNIAKKMTGVTKVAVANGIPDALSIASIASAANQPILLTDKDALPASVADYLASAGITASDVIGGTGIISDAVVAGLPGATRHFGMTAYDTNNQVIQDFAAALQFDNVYVANGETAIDALAGAPLAAQTKSAIVLTDGNTVPAAAAFTFSKSSAGSIVTALGGTAVVPESVRVGVAAGDVTSVPGELAIVSVTALDDSNRFIEINFNKAVTGLQTSDIVVENADTLDRYGIKNVQMSTNGLTATVELYAADDASVVLEYLQDYNVTVKANGTILKTTFNRAYSKKVRVQDINVGDEQIVVYDDKTGDKLTLEIPANINFAYQAALGELVQVWYNGDNELTNYSIASSTAKNDAIEVTKVNQIKLLSENKKYDVSEEDYANTSNEKFTFYLDGEKVDIADQLNMKFNFAKVGFDKSGDIEFVSAYTLKNVLIVDSIEGNEVIGVEGSASAGSFDAKDATIIKDGNVISKTDLKQGDLLFFNDDADDKDGYAEVLNNEAATGEIDTVYSDSIEVGGEIYDFDYDAEVVADFDYTQQAVYIDEDGDVTDVDSDAAKDLQAAGEVTLYTDYAGNLIFISGDVVNVDSNEKIAVLTEDILGYATARDKVEIEALTQDGDELSFDIDLESLDTITVDGIEHDIDNGGSKDWTASLIAGNTGINLDENGGSGSVDIMFNNEADAGSLVKLHLDDEGNLEELDFFSGNSHAIGYGTITGANILEAGDTYLSGYKLTSGTLLFNATDDSVNTDAEDIAVYTFGDYNGSKIINGNFIYNADQEVVAVWYDTTDSSDVTYEEAVVTKVLRNTKQEVVSVTVYAGGELQTFTADKVTGFEAGTSLAKGDVVILELDKDNNTVVKGFATAGSDITNDGTDEYATRVKPSLTVDSVDVGNKTVTFTNGDSYKLAEGGLVLDGKDNNDITIKSLSDLRGKTNVTVVLDEKTGSFAKFFVIEN